MAQKSISTEGTSPNVDDYFGAEIDSIGLQALQAYQRQHEIADRIWNYFNQYSGLVVLIALIAVVFRAHPAVYELPRLFVLVPALAYLSFFVGNHIALRLTVLELAQLRAVAISKTRLRLQTSSAGKMMLFHLVMAATALGLYLGAWFYILYVYR